MYVSNNIYGEMYTVHLKCNSRLRYEGANAFTKTVLHWCLCLGEESSGPYKVTFVVHEVKRQISSNKQAKEIIELDLKG